MWVLFGSFFMFSMFFQSNCTTKLCCVDKSTMKHLQKPNWQLDLRLFSYRLLEVHVCWFLNWIHSSYQLCSLLSVEWLLIFEDPTQSFLNMCLYNAYSLILIEQHTHQIGAQLRNQPLETHLPYVTVQWIHTHSNLATHQK